MMRHKVDLSANHHHVSQTSQLFEHIHISDGLAVDYAPVFGRFRRFGNLDHAVLIG